MKVLCMKAGDMKVCLDVSCIIKVILLPALERCPASVKGLVGMLNYAGESIYVMDLYTLLSGKREAPYTLNNSIVIVEKSKTVFGLMVDEIDEIKQVNRDDMQQVGGLNDSLIAGSLIFNNELYLLLKSNFESYLTFKEDKSKKVDTRG